MEKIYSASQLSVSSYQNRKGEKKYQIVLNKDLLEKLLQNDREIINFIRSETENWFFQKVFPAEVFLSLFSYSNVDLGIQY